MFPNGRDLSGFLAVQQLTFQEAIHSLSEVELQRTPTGDLCNEFIRKFTLHAPEIDESRARTEYGDAEVVVNVRLYDDGFIWNRPCMLTGSRIALYVPFVGDPRFFRFRPQSRNLHRPRANVRGNELQFAYDRPAADFAGMPAEVRRDVRHLKRYLAWIAVETGRFNSSIRESAPQHIRSRREKLRQDRQLAATLGFPAQPTTWVAPTATASDAKFGVLVEPLAGLQERQTRESPAGSITVAASVCYTSIRLNDQTYRLTPTQAHIIRILHEHFKQGVPEVHQQALLEQVDSTARRLRAVFKDNLPARDALISAGERKGSVRLNPTVAQGLASREDSTRRNQP